MMRSAAAFSDWSEKTEGPSMRIGGMTMRCTAEKTGSLGNWQDEYIRPRILQFLWETLRLIRGSLLSRD